MLSENLKKIIKNKIDYYREHHNEKFTFSWWKIVISIFCSLFVLYYFIVGSIISNIDKTPQYEINNNTNNLKTIDVAVILINREINEKLWTPNLPFFFPTYFLDNMPNFQLGLMSAVSDVTSSLAAVSVKKQSNLVDAANFLKYSGKIWMFAPDNALTPVPSANSQYRKARKELTKFNQEIIDGSEVFYKTPEGFASILKNINKALNESVNEIDEQIRENSKSFRDNKADNVFYYNQGKIYAFSLLLKSLGDDYKDIILSKNAYQDLTSAIKALQDASNISPRIIRNAEIDATFAPNHLAGLGFYILKAHKKIDTIQGLIK